MRAIFNPSIEVSKLNYIIQYPLGYASPCITYGKDFCTIRLFIERIKMNRYKYIHIVIIGYIASLLEWTSYTTGTAGSTTYNLVSEWFQLWNHFTSYLHC